MARVTQPYKNTTSHRLRSISTEQQFNSGMKYTNQPLGDGYVKTLVNFKLHNDGESLTPRGGIKHLAERVWDNSEVLDNAIIYWTGSVFVNNYDRSDAEANKIVILGYNTADGLRCSDMSVLIEYGNGFISATPEETYTGYLNMSTSVSAVHDMTCVSDTVRNPICAELNGNLYFMHSGKLSVLDIAYTDSTKTSAHFSITECTPKEIAPSLTINYGYNMLKAQPYTFSNTLIATGALYGLGVVPYDDDGNLLLSARPGTPITFNLIYRYPQVHVSNAETYRVQWELQDNDAGTSAEIIQGWQQSPVYNPGDEIKLNCTPTVQNFSLIARIYISSDIAEQEEEWEANENLQSLCKKEEFVTPECVTTLASYYISSDDATSSKNSEAVVYDLGTAQGMCVWQQRLVAWGIHGAKSTMWVSEVNDPTYFPYPNNVEIFNEDIIKVVPYLTDLLIFTKSSIYRCKLNEDGLTYTTTRVQDKLNMDYDDALSVIAVQNMVFFRSDNYYYMVVPNYSYNTGTYGIQLAPISRPTEHLFDNFSKAILDIINSTYGLSPDLLNYPLKHNLQWYTVQQDGNEVHNIFCISVQQQTTSTSGYAPIGDFCVHIIYDSVLRAWSVQIEESDLYAPCIYNNTATGETEYIKIRSTLSGLSIVKYKYDNKDIVDDNVISHELTYANRQYLDTGNRDFAEDLKKRFREVQFCVNILDRGRLKFNTGFVVDDTPEVLPYRWNVEVIDGSTGTLGVSREYLETVNTPEHTALNTWELDTSVFPDTTMFKIRYHVCGKGYNGSAQIISDNNIPYELRHVSFVYRQMFAR